MPAGATARKAPSRQPSGGRRGAAMGRRESKGGKKEAAGDGKGQNTGEWGETLGGARPPEWTPSPTEWNGRRGAVRPLEWRKPREGPPRSGGGVESSPDDPTRPVEGGGDEFSQDDSTPNGEGGGVESWQDDLTPHTNRGGVESSGDDSTPREVGGPKRVKTLGAPTAPRSQQSEDRCGQGGGNENPPTAMINHEARNRRW